MAVLNILKDFRKRFFKYCRLVLYLAIFKINVKQVGFVVAVNFFKLHLTL